MSHECPALLGLFNQPSNLNDHIELHFQGAFSLNSDFAAELLATTLTLESQGVWVTPSCHPFGR